eukprot:UN12622
MVRNRLEDGSWNDTFFIDRDPTHFRHILNFLREGKSYLTKTGILDGPDGILYELKTEAEFYQIKSLMKAINDLEAEYMGKTPHSKTPS